MNNSPWPIVAALAAGGVAIRYRRGGGNTQPTVDMWKSAQLLTLAAEWIRAGDPDSAKPLLDLVPDETWQFAHDEVVATSFEPRIAAMAGRLSAAAILTVPTGAAPAADRMAQIETLNAVATAIKARMRAQR